MDVAGSRGSDTSKILNGFLKNPASLAPNDLRLLLQLLVHRHRPTYALRLLRKHGLLAQADAWTLAALSVLRYQMEYGRGDHQAMFFAVYSALKDRHTAAVEGFEPLTADLADACSMVEEGRVEEATQFAHERGLEGTYEFDLARLQHLVWRKDFRSATEVIDRRLKESFHSPYFFVCFAKGLQDMGSKVVAADCFRRAIRIEPALGNWNLEKPGPATPRDTTVDVVAYALDFLRDLARTPS